VGKTINLRTVRKQKARDAARNKGTESAALAGETRSESAIRRAEAERASRRLDGHRRDETET
jgi:hypothetical protein